MAIFHADPSQYSVASEQRRSLWTIVREHTSDDEFQLIWHRYAEGLPVSAIASSRDESADALKMRLSRLRKRLRPFLEPFVFDFANSPSNSFTQNRAA